MAAIHIGISGWRYTPWRGEFYPKGLTHKRELQFASRAVNSIEINGSFYALQRPERYAQWYAETPRGFVFSVKAPRFITHIRRLRDIHKPLANFFASGVLELKEKLGPILWQFPPNFKFNAELFETFLEQLPRNTEEAAALARQHDSHLNGHASLKAYGKKPLRHAIEIRNESFVDPAFIRLLKRHNAALVIADTAGKWPYREDLTSDFVYLRLHGAEELYASGYTPEALKRWGDRIEAWHHGRQPPDPQLIAPRQKPKARKSREVFCYFDNDIKVRAPFDARRLLERFHLDKDLATRPGERAAEGVLS
ncbi:Uncharacterized conserved protein YecE, DUF72 family [Pseudomonas frederiksbergensis]|jgi:uncharacterized protein YecE (DUF72 family)|uniref:Uncharacterized conserved protein YecE, DUF72 family n=1 Tax=Pseudomonas frederiksbergensis TaxID=104087 RepID=A0A1H4MWF7_9PSED|nr:MULTISPECIES: DUF72 domain-containing protein [Pseudomonas]PMU09327.1 DUF72 domain-containing protein [Pseudomonas sp. FW305-20]PMU17216.1 DUF72 domain-containing protein [Pseudomonas sp. FW305-122]PMU38104.1 DUF72 domain-containing protein [Pseudomonas sp. FW305-47B]PMX59123.1 DUF72 domain-containing protein [Pseudomonas sp. FW305-33]PMX67855.1 DUF72 domain-containing protein [Pseudomonas sp. FW305-60]